MTTMFAGIRPEDYKAAERRAWASYHAEVDAASDQETKDLRASAFTQAYYADPTQHRASLESLHWEGQQRHWTDPIVVSPLTEGIESLRVLPDFGRHTTWKSLAKLDPDDCRYFCYKDCVIYNNIGMESASDDTKYAIVHVDESEHEDIFEHVYANWFPHRDRQQDFSLACGSFFAAYMYLRPPEGSLSEIMAFHERLCRKLKDLEPDVLERKRLIIEPGAKEPREGGMYHLRDTLDKVLIIIDRKSWLKDGVLLVCKDQEVAHKFGLDNIKCLEQPSEIKGKDYFCSYRLPLKRAMKAVVSQDKERIRKRKEWSYSHDRYYGSDSET